MEIKDYEYVLVPNILKGYKCSTSGECCQSKWRIDIDEIAYEKTRKELEKLNESAEMYFNKNDKNEYTTKFANGYCKLITKDKLCRVHKEFGWECLSDTCKVYPRLLKLTSRGMEMGLVFSCKSSAKLLLTEEKIKIEKIRKDNLFFMKPSTVSFIIPENNLSSNPASRYYELETFMIELMNENGTVGRKLQYISKVLEEYYSNNDIQSFNFEIATLDYKKYTGITTDEEGVNDLIIKIILAKQEDGAKAVATEFINLLKCIKLNNELEKDKVALREEGFSLTNSELEELKKLWSNRDEKVLNNYIACNIFNKEFYHNRHFAMMKLVMLGVLLKFRIILYKKYLKRDLDEKELIYTIKSHDNDFSHGSNFFSSFYTENKMEMDVRTYVMKLLSFL